MQPLAFIAVSPNPAILSEPAHGESDGKEKPEGTPRRCRKVLLVVKVRAAFPARTRASLWHEVAACGLLWMMEETKVPVTAQLLEVSFCKNLKHFLKEPDFSCQITGSAIIFWLP